MINLQIDLLLQQIEKTDPKKVSRAELSCISQLVYYSGIRQKEAVKLRVLDVIDAHGEVKAVIRNRTIIKGIRPITFSGPARDAIKEYLIALNRKNPTLGMKRKPLFPTYKTDRTLRRHWKLVNTNFNEIRKGGIKSHFTRESLGQERVLKIYEEGSEIYRISPRQYYAVVSEKKIQAGQILYDDRCINKMLEIWEKIDHKSPSSKNEATKLLTEANEAYEKLRDPGHRNNYKSLINLIIKKTNNF